jgi:hypothetical protein
VKTPNQAFQQTPKSDAAEFYVLIGAIMAEYDIAFGKRLAETARMVAAEGLVEVDAQRTVLYLSLLSTEIALKAMLEQAGKPVPDIRARSHRLAELLSDLGQCEVEVEMTPGAKRYVSASRIRAIPLSHVGAQSTVGAVIDAESPGVSTYPNQVRYGEVLRHFPADVAAQMAAEVSAYALEHWHSIRIK